MREVLFRSTLPSELLIWRTAEIEAYDGTWPVTSKEVLVETLTGKLSLWVREGWEDVSQTVEGRWIVCQQGLAELSSILGFKKCC